MGRAGLTLIIVTLVTSLLEAGNPRCVEDLPWTRLKAADPAHRALLRQGFERSLTFRQLIADIEVSSWLVFVQVGRCPEKLNAACLLHFVGTLEGRPYLRVIAPHQHRHPDNVTAVLAHELQHAREVARAVGVTNAYGLHELFKRIGRVSVARPGVVTYETSEAIRVEEAVGRELLQTPRRGCAGS